MIREVASYFVDNTIVLSIVTVTLRKMCNVTFVAQREGIEQM